MEALFTTYVKSSQLLSFVEDRMLTFEYLFICLIMSGYCQIDVYRIRFFLSCTYERKINYRQIQIPKMLIKRFPARQVPLQTCRDETNFSFWSNIENRRSYSANL